MSGGIIIQRRAALLLAATDPSLFTDLPPSLKAKVNAIDGSPPSQCTEQDLETLVRVLRIAIQC